MDVYTIIINVVKGMRRQHVVMMACKRSERGGWGEGGHCIPWIRYVARVGAAISQAAVVHRQLR